MPGMAAKARNGGAGAPFCVVAGIGFSGSTSTWNSQRHRAETEGGAGGAGGATAVAGSAGAAGGIAAEGAGGMVLLRVVAAELVPPATALASAVRPVVAAATVPAVLWV